MPRPTEMDERIKTARLLAQVYKQKLVIEQAEEQLSSFVKLAWLVVEPGTTYIHGRHIDAICEHLQAAANGEIRKLIINIPPRLSKSTLLSVCMTPWVWLKHPEKKFVYASYDFKLSKRDSRKARQLIKSAWYQRWWGNRYAIQKDQDEKHRYDTDKGGFRQATAVDVGTTGEGGDYLIYDDPNDVKQMNSDAYIEGVIDFHDSVMASRLNDPKTGVRILIQQRCNERDLTGHILAKEKGWDHLVIPMEYEGRREPTSIGWVDWRKTEGELICPERIGPLEIEELKVQNGPVAYAGQYQQRPSPGEGASFKRDWWNFYNPRGTKTADVAVKTAGATPILKTPQEIPEAFEQVVQAWDMTFKESNDTDLVAGHVWGRVGSNVYLLSRRSERMDFPKTLKAVREMSKDFPCPEKLIEDKANGPAVIATLRNEIPGIIPSKIEAGLESLANSMTGYAEAGNVYLPNPDQHPWVWEIIEQFAVFPRGRHDDDVAAACHAWRRLFDSASNSAAPEFRVAPRHNEPATAKHVVSAEEMKRFIQPHWRRWIAVAPGRPGAALWIAETPTRALRVYRELELEGVDAFECGRRVAEHSIEDVTDKIRVIGKPPIVDVFMERECFAPVEPIGCYAELFESGWDSFAPRDGGFAEREAMRQAHGGSKVAADMVEVEDAAWDRLRDLLRFAPPDFSELDYNREESVKLYRQNKDQWKRYMAAVAGEVYGEYPKIKFADSCKNMISVLGTSKHGEDITDPFLRALLIAVSVPEAAATGPKVVPWTNNGTPKWTGARRMRRAV